MLLTYLVLAPALLLLLGAGSLFVMRVFKTTVGYSWLVAAGISVVAWGLAIYTRFRLPTSVELPIWNEVIQNLNTGNLTADRLSWPMEIALAALVTAVVFTDSARYATLTRAGAWAGTLLLSAVGIFTSLADQVLVLAIGWTAMDLAELLFLFESADDTRTTRQAIVSFGYRLAGTIIVLGTILSNPAVLTSTQPFTLGIAATVTMILGTSLRLGALPLHAPFYQEITVRRGIGTVIRLAPAASALVFLARFSPDGVSLAYSPGLLIVAAAAGLYAAWMWVRAADDLSGRPFWIISLTSMAISCSLRGHREGVIAWGAALIISGGILFLYSARRKGFIVFPIIGLLGFSGLPFTLTASAWEGLVSPPLPGLAGVYILILATLLAGYSRKILNPGDALENQERWILLIYPLGLAALAATLIILVIAGWPGSRTIGIWWAGLSAVLFAAAGMLAGRRDWLPFRRRSRVIEIATSISEPVPTNLQRFFEFSWLNSMLGWGYRVLSLIVSRIIFLLEGDAGVLWAFVLLTLFITVLNAGS